MLIYQKGGCEVRPLQIGGAHTCACGPKSGCARCVRVTQKMVATHALEKSHNKYYIQHFGKLANEILSTLAGKS